jgi:hypothetical protein
VSRFDTRRLARSLRVELCVAYEAERIERLAIELDDGLGMAAVAAVSALEPGALRDFEIATWAHRLHNAESRWFAHLVHPDAPAATLAALADISAVLVHRYGWGAP